MKNKRKPHAAQPRLISRCVWSALALLAVPYAAANSQFADVPLYLQNKSETSKLNVKPNVMLFIDDSGSMNRTPGDKTPTGSEKSRLQVTKDALEAVVRHYQGQVNWGFQTLHDNNSANYNGYTDDWNTILTHINRLTGKGGTPTTRRYYELSKYIIDNTRFRCQKNYVVLMSDGDANGSYDATWVNRGGWIPDPNTVADRMGPRGSNNLFNDPYFGTRQGAPYRHIHHINTSGAVEIWDPVWDRDDGLRWFSQTLATKDFKPAGSASNSTERYWDGHPQDPKDSTGASRYAKQLAETYTVGFGTSLTEAGRKYLELGASKPEYFHNATQAQDLVNAFSSIFSSIEEGSLNQGTQTASTAAPAVSNPGRATAAAIVDVDSGTWSSRLKFYPVKPDGSVDTNGAFTEPLFTNRYTMLNDGKTVNWRINAPLDNAFFGISGGTPTDQNEWKDALLPWTVRSVDDTNLKTLAESRKYSRPYRIRDTNGKRDLGDILDSNIATIGKQVNGRTEFMVTAANDGMVHLFQSHDNNNPYALKLSYIPAAMERDDDKGNPTTMGKYLKDVAHENYGQSIPHRYMVNGGIVVRRTADSAVTKGQQSFLFGAMGQGGRGAYALNIGGQNRETGAAIGLNAADSNWLSQVPLFETAKGAGNTLGYTVGTPQIGRVSIERVQGQAVDTAKGVRYAGFLASGYRVKGTVAGKTNETALYVYDMLGQNAYNGKEEGATKGTLIRKINVASGVGGLSSPTLVDTDFDGIVDIAYAGDYGGNMYRFDLRDEPSKWSATRIYAGIATQPITAAPAVSRRSNNKYVVIFGTGSDIYQDDLDNKDRQAMYGIFDDLDQTAATQAEAKFADGGTALLEQTLTETTAAGQTVYTLSGNKITAGHKGWRINLPANGERVVVKPTMILRTAVFSTRSYENKKNTVSNNGDVCIPTVTKEETSSSTMLLNVNAETGEAPGNRDARVQFIDKTDNSQPYYAGVRQTGLTSFTFMDGAKKTDSPVTADGDSGGSGTDGDLKPANKDVPVNQCFHKQDLRTLLTNKGASYKVDGRVCALKRISWRELFF